MRKSDKKEIKRRCKEIVSELLKAPNFKLGWFKRIKIISDISKPKYLTYKQRMKLKYLVENGYKVIIKPILFK